MTKFQLVVTIVFGLFIVAGVAAFSLKDSSSRKQQASPVIMWGTFDKADMTKFLKVANEMYKDQLNITYVQKSPSTIESDLIESIANGKSPDVVIVANDQLIMTERARLYPVPFTTYSERDFKDNFADATEDFLSFKGILAFPIGIDPLIMYWNRDLFSASLLTTAPKYWDELFTIAGKLTKRNPSGDIDQSAVALGDMDNVMNGKEILSTLIMQGGSSIINYNYSTNSLKGDLKTRDPVTGLVPAEQALSFFTEFSNPVKSSYSWNKAMPMSLTAFLSGRLGIYFGFGSEIVSVRDKNPNLNFDVAKVPQIPNAPRESTYGRIYGLSILNSAKNPTGAYTAIGILTSEALADTWFSSLHIPTARRSLLSKPKSAAYESTIFTSAIISKTWLDPEPSSTRASFKEMVDSVTSGRARVTNAVDRVAGDIDRLLRNLK